MSQSAEATIDDCGLSQSTLVVAPSEQTPDDQMCSGLLARDPLSDVNILSITLSATPEDRLAAWERQHGSELPARATIIDAGESATAEDPKTLDVADPADAIDVLPSSPDLLDLALTVSQQLGAWTETDATTQVCFHSLSSLAAIFTADEIADFVSALNDLCSQLDVSIHYHISPEESEEMLVMLRPLHDTVVKYTGSGWSVTTRGDEEPPSFRRHESPPGGISQVVPDSPELVPLPYSFDTVMGLLDNPIRRSLLYHLKDRDAATIELEELVATVHRRAESIPIRDPPARDQLKLQLIHTHLPKLAEAGIVTLDQRDNTVEYKPNPAVVSFLQYIEQYELG